MAAQLVEGFIVLAFLQVREFMRHNHPQEWLGHLAKQRRDADFALGLELGPLHPRDARVGTQHLLQDAETAVEHHLAERARRAQIRPLELLHVAVKRRVAPHRMRVRILRPQHVRQLLLFEQLPDLQDQVRRIPGQIFIDGRGRHG